MTESPPSQGRAICVYCSARENLASVYVDAAAELGRLIAEQAGTLVFGGNDLGLMKVLADQVKKHRGHVVGVTTRIFGDKGVDYLQADELIIKDTMRQRKAEMESRADAFIAMPGGFGTLEELFEIIVGRQLAYHHKPIVILNVAGFYDPLLAMLEHVYTEGYASEARRDSYHVATTPQQALDLTRKSQPAFKPGT